jgi:hypothetical protein
MYPAAVWERGYRRGLHPLYTILLLVSDEFEGGKPTIGTPFLTRVEDAVMQHTRILAELLCISYGLANIIRKWTSLDDYLQGLLVVDFMEPKTYSKLLFDDESFGRSRKYFWAIGCLSEFDITIADNIKQWDMYREARIDPLLQMEKLEEEFLNANLETPPIKPHVYPAEDGGPHTGQEIIEKFKKLVKENERHRESLVGLQHGFKLKLETVKSLRDGVSQLFLFSTTCSPLPALDGSDCEASCSMQALWSRAERPHDWVRMLNYSPT